MRCSDSLATDTASATSSSGDHVLVLWISANRSRNDSWLIGASSSIPALPPCPSVGWRSVIGPGPSTPLDVSPLKLRSGCVSARWPSRLVHSVLRLPRTDVHDALRQEALGVRADQLG